MRLTAYALKRVFIKRAVQPRVFEQLCKYAGAALRGIGDVALPRVVDILLNHCPEFQRHGLRQAVIYVIERAGVDVMLPLPVLAVGVEGDLSVQFYPRSVDAHQFLPAVVALTGRPVRIGVDFVLEVVHHGAVRYECDGACKVAVEELAGILSEEVLD